MKKLHITSTALLTAALLLSGCNTQNNESDSRPNSTLDHSDNFSENNSPENSKAQSDTDNSTTDSSAISDSTSDNSTDSSDSDSDKTPDYSHLNIPTEFTDEDRELQGILTEVVEGGAAGIYRWFIGMGLGENPHFFLFPESSNPELEHLYFPIPDNYMDWWRDQHIVPTTRAGMEELMLKYFSAGRTERFIGGILKGEMTENPDGTFSVTFENGSKSGHTFIEIDGRLYRMGSAGGGGMGINIETAKVKSKTDDTIEFTYLGFIYNPDYINYPESSYNAEGVLKFERGGWKLDEWDITHEN